MHNELLFFIQVFGTVVIAFAALQLGSVALTTWVTVQALIANLFVLKQINLFGFDVTAADSYAIGSFVGLNFLQEYFGKEKAQEATKICFFFLLFFAVISRLHLLYEPSVYDSTQAAFHVLLSPAPRLFIASLGTFFIVQRVDILFFSFLRRNFSRLGFSVRMGISLIVMQLLDTVLFSVTGLYGSVISLMDIILVSFLIKIIAIFSFTSIIHKVKR